MTLEYSSGGLVTADYEKVSEVCITVLDAIRTESIGYGILGCALALGRLASPEVRLPPKQEIRFVADLMEWVNGYIVTDVKGLTH